RFRAARNTVARRWGQRGHTDSVSLITVGARSRLVAFDWNTGLDFGHLVDDLVPSAGQADWVGAARRAASLAVRDRSARVAVITDDYGVQAAQQALTAVGFASQSVEVVSVGSTLANVGVRSVGAALRGGGPDQWAVSGTLVTSGFDTGDVVRVVASFRPPGTTTFL